MPDVPPDRDESVPIACSLTAAGREQRAALVAQLAADALVERERDGRALVLRFRGEAGVEERVRAWAALEAECCPFLTMSVEGGASLVTLRIEGPPEADAIIDELLPLAPFSSRASRTIAKHDGPPAAQLP